MNLLSIFYKKDNMRNHVRNEKKQGVPWDCFCVTVSRNL